MLQMLCQQREWLHAATERSTMTTTQKKKRERWDEEYMWILAQNEKWKQTHSINKIIQDSCNSIPATPECERANGVLRFSRWIACKLARATFISDFNVDSWTADSGATINNNHDTIHEFHE